MASYGNALNGIMNALAILRGEDEQMQMQTAQVFIAIAMTPGITSQKIAQAVGLSQSSVSRNTAALGEWHRLGKPGHNLIEAVEDPRERRRKIHFLTAKGRTVAAKVIEAVTGQVVTDFTAPTYKEWLRSCASDRAALRSEQAPRQHAQHAAD